MLKLKEKESLEKLSEVIQAYFEKDESGHGFDHIQRVVRNATLFLKDLPQVDHFSTLCIAYLHDVFDHKINKVDNVEEALLDYMGQLDIDFFGKEAVIALGASQIGYSIRDSVENKLFEADIVSDADYMDAMGPFGVIRTFQYGYLHDHSVEEMVCHLPDKLIKLQDLLVTTGAKEMGLKRHQLLEDFYNLYQEDSKV